MTVKHSSLTAAADLHEPKGLAQLTGGSSDANKIYKSDGAGSGSWALHHPHGNWYYSNIGTGTTLTSPTSYTLVNPATTAAHLSEFTHNSLGRLTYTGTADRHTHIVFDVTFKHSTGSGQDCYFAVFKNGVEETGSNVVQTADSANYQQVAFHWDEVVSTNDYIEVYAKTASGNLVVHKAYCFIMAM